MGMATATDTAGVRPNVGGRPGPSFAMLSDQRRRFLIAATELDLHPAQAGALLQLADAATDERARGELGCDNSNVTGLVDRLEARGLVARQASPTIAESTTSSSPRPRSTCAESYSNESAALPPASNGYPQPNRASCATSCAGSSSGPLAFGCRRAADRSPGPCR